MGDCGVLNVICITLLSIRRVWELSVRLWVFLIFRTNHINTCFLHDNWQRSHYRITTRLPGCARTLQSIKTDMAAFAWLVITRALGLLRRKGCYTHISVMRWHSEIRQLLEDRHLSCDAWVFQNWNATQKPLSTERIAAVQCDDASDNRALCHNVCLQDVFRCVRHLTAEAPGCV